MRLLHEIVVPRIAADWSIVADYLGYEVEYKRLIKENCRDNAQRCVWSCWRIGYPVTEGSLLSHGPH